MAKKKKKKAETGLSNRDCIKGLKSKNLENVFNALNSETVKNSEFLEKKGGLIPLTNLLVSKRKELEIVQKVLNIIKAFLADDAQHAVTLMEAGYKGASKWHGVEAFLPFLNIKPQTKEEDDGISIDVHECAWSILNSVTEVMVSLSPNAKHQKYQSSFLNGGAPIACLFSMIKRREQISGVLDIASTISMADNDAFVTEFTELILQTGNILTLVELAETNPEDSIFTKLLVTLLQLSKSPAARFQLAPAGILDVYASALQKGREMLLSKAAINLAEMQWFVLTLESYTTYLCESALDTLWQVEERNDVVYDRALAALDPLVDLLSLQTIPEVANFIGQVVVSLDRICNRTEYSVNVTLHGSQNSIDETKQGEDEGNSTVIKGDDKVVNDEEVVSETAENEDSERKQSEADVDGSASDEMKDDGEHKAIVSTTVIHERTKAVRTTLFQTAFEPLLSILSAVKNGDIASDIQRVLFTLLYCDGDDVGIINADENSKIFSIFNMLVTDTSGGENAVVGVRLLAHVALSVNNCDSILQAGTFDKLLDILANANTIMEEGKNEFISRVSEVVGQMCKKRENAAHLAGAKSGVEVIKGLFYVLFHSPKEIAGIDGRATAAQNRGETPVAQKMDAQMQAAATLANVVEGAGDEGTSKVLDGADALFDKIELPDNSDLLQQGILELFAGLVKSEVGRMHTVELLGEDRLVHLIVDLLASDSASYTKIKAAVVANVALLMLPLDDIGRGSMRNSHDSLLQKALSRGVLNYLLALNANCPSLQHKDDTLRQTMDPLITYLIQYGKTRYSAWETAKTNDVAATEKEKAPSNKKNSRKSASKKESKKESNADAVVTATNSTLPPFTPAEWSDLLNKSATFSRYNFQSATPLHTAIVAACTSHALNLLEHGACCDVTDGRWSATPFLLALMYGETSICSSILRKSRSDVDVDSLDTWNNPLLKYAFMTPINEALAAMLDVSDGMNKECDDIPILTFSDTNRQHIEEFLALGVDLNVADDEGNFPLHWTIKGVAVKVQYQFQTVLLQSSRAKHNNTVTGISQLLDHGAKVNNCNCRGETPLHTAVLCGDADAAICLLDAGANPNLFSSTPGAPRQLPLHVACAAGTFPLVLVTRLIQMGLGTPLRAAHHDNTRRGLTRQQKKLFEVNNVVARVFEQVVAPSSICEYGARLKDIAEFADGVGNRPLHYACGAELPSQWSAESEDVRNVDNRCTLQQQLPRRKSIVDYLLHELKTEVGAANAVKSKPVHFAAKWSSALAASIHSSLNSVRQTASTNALETDDDLTSEFGAEFAAEPEEKSGGIENLDPHVLLVALAKAGADFNVVDAEQPLKLFTPLHYAIEQSPSLAYFMLTDLAQVSGRTSSIATDSYLEDVDSKIVGEEERTSSEDLVAAHVAGTSPSTLHIACASTTQIDKRLALVRFLIQKGDSSGVSVNDVGIQEDDANTKIPDSLLQYTGTILHLAARNGCVQLVHQLLMAKADTNVNLKSNPSALHLAIRGGHAQCTRELIEAGADFLQNVDERGYNAVFAAVDAREPAVLQEIFGGATVASAVAFPAVGEETTEIVEDPLGPSVVKSLKIGEGENTQTLLDFARTKILDLDPSATISKELQTTQSAAEPRQISHDDEIKLQASQSIYEFVHRRTMTTEEWTKHETEIREREEQEAAAAKIQSQIRKRKAKKKVAAIKKKKKKKTSSNDRPISSKKKC